MDACSQRGCGGHCVEQSRVTDRLSVVPLCCLLNVNVFLPWPFVVMCVLISSLLDMPSILLSIVGTRRTPTGFMMAGTSEPFGNGSCSLITLSGAVAACFAVLFRNRNYPISTLYELSSPEPFIASALLMVASLTIDLILSLILVKAWTLGNRGTPITVRCLYV